MHKKKMAYLVRFAVLIAASVCASAQAPGGASPQGWNAIVQSITGGNVTPSASYATVDLTQYTGNGASDLCSMINYVFNIYNTQASPGQGVVIDARGVPTSALQCSAVNPWSNLIQNEFMMLPPNDAFSNIVLLPAGTIQIQQSWILPNYTHLVGQGPTTTTIQGSNLKGTDMIDMGSEASGTMGMVCYQAAADCPGIVIEHLGLDGDGSGMGIVNCCAQELSRVNDVYIENVTTGLAISDSPAQNSGPYTNISMSAVHTCLSIGPTTTNGVNNPPVPALPGVRGVLGLNCTQNSSSTQPAITIDSANARLTDVSIMGGSSALDGILVGSQGPAVNDQLLNIQGSGLKNLIHISAATTIVSPLAYQQVCPPYIGNATNNVCHLTILGVHSSNVTGTVQDDITGTKITDSYLAMYTLGQTVNDTAGVNVTGQSRFTTAASPGNTYATPWLVGSTAPSGSCSVGAMYSCSSCSVRALWECVKTSTASTWEPIQ